MPVHARAATLSDWSSVIELEAFLDNDYRNCVAPRWQYIDGNEIHCSPVPTCVDYARGLQYRAELAGKRLSTEIIEIGDNVGFGPQKVAHMLCKAVVGSSAYLVEAQTNMCWYWRELYNH